ncbi:MAG: diheme cytochrome c, partial [Gammaproteobacteria bacterium]|nr:diheme cytochrome c [Gammaproteobacteria bacterium]
SQNMKSTIAISAVIFTVGVVMLPVVWGDSDFNWREIGEHKHRSTDVSVIVDPVYKEECGACHMVYPPGLLPARSWHKVMSELDNHFGDNAEVDVGAYRSITEFLSANNADESSYRRSAKFNGSIRADDAPVRITDTPYFRHKHDDVPDRLVSGNPKVKSFSQCNACHAKAEQGSFDEHDIRIPGYGMWDE